MKKKHSQPAKKNEHQKHPPRYTLERVRDSFWRGTFQAMAGPCEILLETDDTKIAESMTQTAFEETCRIERKFSRYRDNSIVQKINTSPDSQITVDDETALLLDFAKDCYELSEGLFDITSGILRKAWKFKKGSTVPLPRKIEALVKHVGWHKVIWKKPSISLPRGMEIDLGGICKEYAVDRVLLLLKQISSTPCLVNFGGDLSVSGPRSSGAAWSAGIENLTNSIETPAQTVKILQGALATSGSTHRFIQKNKKRYSHILNPKTGWPVENAPASVTVADTTCTNAGILATLAMLQGECAEQFLQQEGVRRWIIWG